MEMIGGIPENIVGEIQGILSNRTKKRWWVLNEIWIIFYDYGKRGERIGRRADSA
jgi:hypothetical protein